MPRLRARYRLRRRVALWYHGEYAAHCLGQTCRVLDLPLDRVERAVALLASEGVLAAADLRTPPRASFQDLVRVHTSRYLESTTDAETLGRIFAIDPAVIDVDGLLGAQRRAVGGTVAAALAAARGLRHVAFNLGGGFHHAEPDAGSGFCVYNDVAVAIAVLRHGGYRRPIAIVDLDYHQGNGNLVTFAEDESVLTYSLQGSVWSHVAASADVSLTLPPGTDDDAYLAALGSSLPEALARHRPGVVFFIAGNDVLAGDRLGDFALTPGGVFERDRLVLRWAQRLGASVVVTLGGGYSPPAWRCTANLVRFLLAGVAPAPEEGLHERFDRIARSLDPFELQRNGEELALTEADVMADLFEAPPRARVLGYYSTHGIELALERYGLLDGLRRRGLSDLALEVDPSDPERQLLRVRGRKDASESLLLLELVVRRRFVRVPQGPDLPCLSVEWLLLQDPAASFSLERPAMPGQAHPGLGMAVEVEELLVQACHRIGLAGVVSRPSHYHTAAVASRRFRFLDPRDEGTLLALKSLLAPFSLAEATRLIGAGAVRARDGVPWGWSLGDQLLPVSEDLCAYFESPGYRTAAENACQRLLDAGLHVAGTWPLAAEVRSPVRARRTPRSRPW